MALADLEEAQQLEVGRRAMHQMMAGWDAFLWLVVENQLAAPVLPSDVLCDGSIEDLGQLRRDLRCAFKLALADLEEAQQLEVGRCAMHQMMAG